MMVTNSRKLLVNGGLAHLAAAVAASLLFCTALAQNAPAPQLGVGPATEPQTPSPQTPSPQTASPEAPPPRRSNPPGLFGAIGRWVDDSIGNMTSGLNNARDAVGGLGGQASDAAKGAADAARDAATSVVRIPATSFVTGRTHCVRAANGGPDCAAATDALCRSKGFSAGTSLHIQSEQKCPVWGWIAGEKPVGECGTETYVTSAMCR